MDANVHHEKVQCYMHALTLHLICTCGYRFEQRYEGGYIFCPQCVKRYKLSMRIDEVPKEC